MLGYIIQFQLHLISHYLIGGYYRTELIVDGSHYHYRRLSAGYKRKQSMVKNVWIGAGLMMLAFPLLPVIFVLTLTTTLISFCLLDETP